MNFNIPVNTDRYYSSVRRYLSSMIPGTGFRIRSDPEFGSGVAILNLKLVGTGIYTV